MFETRLVDDLHTQHHDDWVSIIIMDSDDFSVSDLTNPNALEYAGKGTPFRALTLKYFCPFKYLTHNEFDGDGYKSFFHGLATSAQKCGFNIIQKGY